MNELLPCPFCGSHNLVEGYHSPFVICDDCGAFGPGHADMTHDEAIAAWNSRAQTVERTCRNVDKRYSVMFKCSECGHWECQDFDGEKIFPQKWNYCPNCGAKVVGK